MAESVLSRFLRLVSFDTQSSETSGLHPSTPGQKVLADALAAEFRAMGVSCRVTAQAYLYAEIPATPGLETLPALGLIAHLDTSCAVSGRNVRPSVVTWNGGDIPLGEGGLTVRPPDRMKGMRIVIADGTTLLGADDKAGVAEICAFCEQLLEEKRPHGPLKIAFTPDEEIGEGTLFFDYAAFGAEFAYTLDGGAIGGIEYENFNAAKAKIVVSGISAHPGDAKGRMLNALTIAMEFHSLLPSAEVPEHTSGREGFYHLCSMKGDVSSAELEYLLRTFDPEDMENRKRMLLSAAGFLNKKYARDIVRVDISDQYRNMREYIEKVPFLTEYAFEAMRRAGVTPFTAPIRGGTDGAQLSRNGLPCPNLCTGGYGFHGKTEFACVEEMETCVRILLNLADIFREHAGSEKSF